MFLLSQADGYELGGINPSSPAQALPAKVQVAPWALEERWDVTWLQSQFPNVLTGLTSPRCFPPLPQGHVDLSFVSAMWQQGDSSGAFPGHLGWVWDHHQWTLEPSRAILY